MRAVSFPRLPSPCPTSLSYSLPHSLPTSTKQLRAPQAQSGPPNGDTATHSWNSNGGGMTGAGGAAAAGAGTSATAAPDPPPAMGSSDARGAAAVGRVGSGAALEVEDAEEEEGPAFAGVFRSTGPAGATGVNGTGDLCKQAPSAASCKGMQGKDRGGRGGGAGADSHQCRKGMRRGATHLPQSPRWSKVAALRNLAGESPGPLCGLVRDCKNPHTGIEQYTS